MKRLKQLLVIGLVAVMAFALSACGSKSSKTLSSISVDASAAKTEYTVGESFSSDGIIVTATYSDDSTADIASGNYTVDSTAYSSTTAGTYSITVSYTESDVTKTASYTVTVSQSGSGGTTDTVSVSSITLDTSAVTCEYYVGQALNLSGIKATAALSDGSTASLTNSELTVNSSAVDIYTAGSYTVTVSYTLGGATASADFTVSVIAHSEISAGLYITKTTTEYTVESTSGVTVSVDDLSVYLAEDNVVSDTALDSGSYELSYYKVVDASIIGSGNIVVIDSLENLTEGKYEIWATAQYTVSGATDASGNAYAYEISNCVEIYVYDEIASIALANADTGTFTQAASTEDEMSATWEYILTYTSGNTETISGTNASLTISGLTTSAVITDATATVTYTKVNAKGETKDVSCEVTYSITKASGNTVSVSVNISDLAIAGTLGTTITTETTLASGISVTATEDKTVTVDTNDKDIDGFSFTYRLKLGGAGSATSRSIKIETTGAATITVYAISSSSGTERTLALYDKDYTLLDGTQSDDGTAITKYTFTVDEAGTYYIASMSGGINVYYISVVS